MSLRDSFDCDVCGFDITVTSRTVSIACPKCGSEYGINDFGQHKFKPSSAPFPRVPAMGKLREIKPDVREWSSENGGEAQLRADLEEALRDGERITLIWSLHRPANDSAADMEFNHISLQRQGVRVTWLSHAAILMRLGMRWIAGITKDT